MSAMPKKRLYGIHGALPLSERPRARSFDYHLSRRSFPERFWSRVDRADDESCWLWVGQINLDGYGTYEYEGHTRTAHRVAWILTNGPIAAGLQVDHLCRVRRCVNPHHLEPVTARENVLRSEGISAKRARVTHCPQGHEYTPENTRIKRGRYRDCRACDRERHRIARKGEAA